MHLTHFANGRGGTLHLCADCARKLGLGAFSPPFFAGMEDFVERLARLGAAIRPLEMPPAAEAPDEAAATCPSCGAPLAKMADNDSAGCPDCLLPILAASRQEEVYLGKFPASLPMQERTRLLALRLRDRLRRAVRAERYEEAAALRNAIAALPGNPAGGTP